MRNFVLCLVLLFACASVKAQSNYQKGYVITSQKDTIHGLVNYRTTVDNMAKCQFKKTEDGQIETFYPGQITGYRLTGSGKYYVSLDINLNGMQKKVFAEYLVGGDMNLYYYSNIDNFQEYYFFETPQETVPVTKKADEHIGARVEKDVSYIGRLQYIFRDRPDMGQGIKSPAFNSKTMINLVKKYNSETGGSVVVYKDPEVNEKNVTVGFSAYAGIRHTSYTFNYYYFGPVDNNSSVYPLIGGQISFTYPRWSKALSLLVDVSFSGFKTEGMRQYTQEEIDAGETSTTPYSVKSLLAGAKIGVKYTYPSGKIRPFIEGGFSSSFLLNASGHYKYVMLESETPNSVFIGFYGGIGCHYMIKEKSSVFIRATYEQTTETNPLQTIGSESIYGNKDKMKALHFSVGYSF